MGEVLAHAFALCQGFEGRCIDVGALALIDKVSVNALHQVLRCGQHTDAGRETGSGISRELRRLRTKRRGKNKLGGGVEGQAGLVTKLLARLFPSNATQGQCAGLGTDDAVRHHIENMVRRLQRKEAARITKDVERLRHLLWRRADQQGVAQQALIGVAHRLQVGHVLRGLYRRQVVVARLVRDSELHQVPTLCLDSIECVKYVVLISLETSKAAPVH